MTASSVALATALTFSAHFSVEVDDDGVIDWDASMPGIMAKVEEMAQATRDDRDDVLSVLNRNSGDFVQEQILVSEVLKLRERRENSSRKNRDEDAEQFEFSLAEMSAHSARLDKFLTANKPEKDNDDGKSLLLSQRGRSGGIQTRSNAVVIAAKRKKLA